MPDREKVIYGVNVTISFLQTIPGDAPIRLIEYQRDALALLKEHDTQKFFVDENGKITPIPIVIQNCPLKEQEDKPVLDEFGKCFLNALKRQLDMKLTMIELLITPEFAEKIVELIEKMFD